MIWFDLTHLTHLRRIVFRFVERSFCFAFKATQARNWAKSAHSFANALLFLLDCKFVDKICIAKLHLNLKSFSPFESKTLFYFILFFFSSFFFLLSYFLFRIIAKLNSVYLSAFRQTIWVLFQYMLSPYATDMLLLLSTVSFLPDDQDDQDDDDDKKTQKEASKLLQLSKNKKWNVFLCVPLHWPSF